MNIAKDIRASIDRLPKGYIFTYQCLLDKVNKDEAVIKTLNRMVASGRIEKISKGKYYKPKQTVFGNLQPNQDQVVKDLLEKNGKTVGYLTGYSIYGRLGLTSQVSNTIQIGKNEIRPSFRRGRFTISFVKQKNIITKGNIPLLQILDAIRYIKRIPDTTIESASKRLLVIIKDLTQKDRSEILRLAKKYPPSTKALLGALIDEAGYGKETNVLERELNSITIYKIPGARNVLSAAPNWNIK